MFSITESNMRIAINGAEKTYHSIFSLIAELELQGYTADALSLQAILDSLKSLVQTIKSDVTLPPPP